MTDTVTFEYTEVVTYTTTVPIPDGAPDPIEDEWGYNDFIVDLFHDALLDQIQVPATVETHVTQSHTEWTTSTGHSGGMD